MANRIIDMALIGVKHVYTKRVQQSCNIVAALDLSPSDARVLGFIGVRFGPIVRGLALRSRPSCSSEVRPPYAQSAKIAALMD